MKIDGVYNYRVSGIDSDGRQSFFGMLEPERLDSHGLRCGRAFDVTVDWKRNKTIISKFRWIGGSPHCWEVIKVIKGEIFDEIEIPNLLKKMGVIGDQNTLKVQPNERKED